MAVLGTGRAEAITPAHVATLADELGCHPADLEAIAEVESSGFGWYPDGRMKILFEKHWMYKLTSGAARQQAVNVGVARKRWISPKKGGYRDQATPDARYGLLAKAMKISGAAAFGSISMGRFQIMGFNYEICGFTSARAMFDAFVDSEVNQLRAFANFLRKKGLVPALKRRDFDKIEEVYNGGGLGGTYARRMRDAATDLRAGKWRDYRPGSMEPATQEPEAPSEQPPTTAPTVEPPVPVPTAPEPPQNWLAALLELIITALLGRRW